MTEHTPGPWRTIQQQTGHRAWHILADDPSMFAVVGGYPSHAEANARLIAAAPELLAALRELVDATPTPLLNERQRRAFFAAGDVIVKARESRGTLARA